MIDKIIEIAKVVAAILPFVALCFASKKVNLPKGERSRQVLMPIAALIYVIVAMSLMHNINEWLLRLIDNIPKWIAALAGFSWMPEKIGAVLLQVSSVIASFLEKLNLGFWIFFISNTVIILVYMIVKKICIKIMAAAVKTDGVIHTKISGFFYGYFEFRNCWCLKQEFVQMRSMFKVFYYSAVVLSSLLMLVSGKFYNDGLIKAIFYPVFGVLVVGELYFYLDGATRREFTNDILGEDEDAYRTVNYSLLRKFLRSVFGDKLLSENTSINSALAYDVTTDDIIRELENSEDPKVVSFASYINALNKTGFQIDHNYLHSSLELLNGKSILFNNPFYNDLIPYAFYPMNRALLSHKKVLVVLGRHLIEDDIKTWIEKGIESVTNIPFMWKIGVLNSEEQDLDIGIVTRSMCLDIDVHNANSKFLEEVGYFVVIEPSKLISTAQIGLNLLVKKCRGEEEKEIVYCLCDKNCDGLIDAMSHILMTSITEVSATKKHLGTSSYMCWEADADYLHHRLVPNISRYLGLGTELSFAALKNQVSKTKWYGGEAFPVTDIRWIDKQYYYDLTKYASLPTSQEAMDEHFITSSNFWSAETEKNSYLTVEDEANNMFEILRDFSTRTTEQGFINVISSEYLLKDYMADNASIFEADAKAIPYIVADYARSNRNTILRLVLMMSTYPVKTEVLKKELSLLGVKVFDLKKQLWYELYNCYCEISKLSCLPEDYKDAVEAVYKENIEVGGGLWNCDIIESIDAFSLKSGQMETSYSITDTDFLELCVSELRSAGYVAEDEKGEKYYLGSELKGHIYQKYLPGQFFTFGGKYYEMQYLTADGQILVRRAADHIKGRPSYRQIREYAISDIKPSAKIGAQQNIAGMKIVKEFADITASTSGYYRMEKYNDFATAKCISFEGEKNGIPERVYRNKEILRIELPEFDGKLTDNIRYTVTVLFNEIFRTLFAENQAYISAVTDTSFLTDNQAAQPLTYSLKGDGCELIGNAIYIIEDSQLDLGLTVAVERNLERIFSIIHDYLKWHYETLENSLNPPPEPQPPIVFGETEETEKPKKKGIFAAIGRGIKKVIDKIKGWFKKKPKKGDEVPAEGEEPTGDEIPADETPAAVTPATDGETPTEETPTEETPTEEEPTEETPAKKEKKGLFGWLKRKKKKKELPVEDDVPQVEIPSEEVVPEDGENSDDDTPADAESGVSKEPAELTESPVNTEISDSSDTAKAKNPLVYERKPYHERYYMLFGREEELPFVDLMPTLDYLSLMGFERNPLKQARDGKKIAEYIEATYKPGKPDARYCDFCGTEIYGVEYETLADGRDRCLNCGRTAIKTGEEFRKIFEDVKRNMESFYGIRINAGIKVEMVNSKTLHKRLGQAFIPTPKSDGRVLGVAISDRHGYTLLVENGSPRMASMLTMAHELTHIWQYINWNDKAIRKKYGKKMRLEIYEGMAKWVEIQYAYLINEPATAKREEIITSYRDDEYGRGFLRYRAQYPFSLGTVITKPTPFMNTETPLDPEFCGPFTVVMPTDGINPGDIEGETPTDDGVIPTGAIKGPIERNPQSFKRYAYSLLDAGERSVYEKILDSVNNFAPELTDFGVSVTDTQIQKIIDFVQRDHPEIFWFRHGATFYFDTVTHIVNKIDFVYCMTASEAQKRQEKIDIAIKTFLSYVNDGMSDYEVTLHIYENIIKLVDYDTIGLERQKNSTVSPDVPDDLRSIYGVFVDKKAVCAGYAKAMQYLLNLCGIECTYVTSDTHAWNLIKLEGDYYHLDVTWGDGTDTNKSKAQSEAVNYDCFCITTEEVLRLESHTPEDKFPLPECTATKCNYHRRHGLYFEGYDYDRIRSVVLESAKLGKLDISFKFGSKAVFGEAKMQLLDNGKLREAVKYAGLKSGTRLSSSFTYSQNPDKLTIALFMQKI